MQEIQYLLCFRLQAWAVDYDEEVIWEFVQRHGGFLSIRHDSIDYWLDQRYEVFVLLAWPELVRIPSLDYVV